MVLEFLGHSFIEADLAHRLGTKSFGTPAPNLIRLEKDGYSVTYGSGTLSNIRTSINNGVPRLVFVKTGDLPYWNEGTSHVLVVVGIDEDHIYVNDPAFDKAPQSIPNDYFLLAWSEFDHRFGIITPG
jgi:uncharacterized protein YvpB